MTHRRGGKWTRISMSKRAGRRPIVVKPDICRDGLPRDEYTDQYGYHRVSRAICQPYEQTNCWC